MSSIRIVRNPISEEIPAWVTEALVGIEIGLSEPCQYICIGCDKTQVDDIRDVHNAYSISLAKLVVLLQSVKKYKAAVWFMEQNARIGNIKMILIERQYCEYLA